MHIPPPGVVRNPGPHFDQALGQPVHGTLNLLASTIELPNHMREAAPHLQSGLVGLEAF
jgi:hypothetical protein